jgi:hypothetical protein
MGTCSKLATTNFTSKESLSALIISKKIGLTKKEPLKRASYSPRAQIGQKSEEYSGCKEIKLSEKSVWEEKMRQINTFYFLIFCI